MKEINIKLCRTRPRSRKTRSFLQPGNAAIATEAPLSRPCEQQGDADRPRQRMKSTEIATTPQARRCPIKCHQSIGSVGVSPNCEALTGHRIKPKSGLPEPTAYASFDPGEAAAGRITGRFRHVCSISNSVSGPDDLKFWLTLEYQEPRILVLANFSECPTEEFGQREHRTPFSPTGQA